MAELLASLQDINTWFTEDKLTADDANTATLQIEAQRLIRGQLASSFTPVTMSAWTSPATTPEQIRSIAGKLIAAFLYSKVYSEEGAPIPVYAQFLYNMAVADLTNIRDGTTTVIGVDGVTILTSDSQDLYFFPDNNAVQPYFRMDQIFG